MWLGATHAADAAITACPDIPIQTAMDAKILRERWEALGQAIGDTEAAVAPLRSRIHALRTELAGRVTAVLDPAKARVEVVRRILGAWDAQERVRLAAAEAEQRKTAGAAAYAHLVAKQDSDHHRQSFLDEAGSQALQAAQGATAEPVDPFAARPADEPPLATQGAPVGPTGKTRKTWVVEILDADKLCEALIALPAGTKLHTALRVHEPTLRKLLANAMGPETVIQANLGHPHQCAV